MKKLLWVLLLVLTPVLAMPAFAAALSPEAVQAWLNANAVLLMFGWGILHKYLPALKRLPNDLIPWVNLLGGFLGQLAMPTVAQAAGVGDVAGAATLGAADMLVRSFVHSSFALLLYEGYGRALLEKLVGLKKSVR